MRRLRRAAIVLVLVAGAATVVGRTTRQAAGSEECTVARIVDGDTLVCDDGRRVRLLLIDTPEMDQGPFGERARETAAELAPPGTRTRLEYDVQRLDPYARELAHVHLPDGTILNQEMLRRGMAVVLVYPPNVNRVERYRAVADSAREARRGLWAVDAFQCLPVDHRAGRCGG